MIDIKIENIIIIKYNVFAVFIEYFFPIKTLSFLLIWSILTSKISLITYPEAVIKSVIDSSKKKLIFVDNSFRYDSNI